ncbi:Mucosa-associated lymphoid tissue lymphoma translocation protein 1-like protein [Microtus ochrogaster]|uniref:Mucosa-associated lymphoid tissue lymphoma translocation protein 1-like protein n=1 Tax=Microtus ochrogaster TaxID=79684 RepID=A0A8J6KXL4_MICOH|nr:Mucosa-associated lymphoid tissue lymphoma translocation protein 1-like protein [Microtus ochrogaster]
MVNTCSPSSQDHGAERKKFKASLNDMSSPCNWRGRPHIATRPHPNSAHTRAARPRPLGPPPSSAGAPLGFSGEPVARARSSTSSCEGLTVRRTSPSAPVTRGTARSKRKVPTGAEARSDRLELGSGATGVAMSLWGQPLQASLPPAVHPPPTAPSGPPSAPPAGATLNRLPEPLLRRLSESLDRAPEGRGWRQLAELAGSRGRLRLSCLDLEQCSLKVLEPEGSPSLCLLKLMGEKGCTVTELNDFLQALEHTEVLQLLNPPGLKITVNPESKAVLAGQFVKLCCRATGHPFVQYQWFKMNKEIPYGNSSELIFNTVHVKDAGFYVCRVNNSSTFEFSEWSQLDVCDVTEVTESFQAKDKVALLIGNMNYWEHPKLKAPLVDVYELTNLLRQLDFKVVSLLDLTEYEMCNAVDEFLLLLDKGVYGLLYYAGHGYENFGNSFMVPVDAPNPYRSENCLCVQNILKLMQEKETGLNVFLLDMCRKRNDYDDTIPILDALKVTANIVFGYATCQGAEAFEIQHSGLANGIFMKFLKDRLLEDKKITVLLDEVAEDMGKCHLTKGKQALEIRSSLSEKRALTDPVQGTACSAESLVRNLQWAKAHELPESMCLKFQCGVHIQLGFAAEFSNVMIIYTSIIHKPPEIIMCDAYVTDFPLEHLVFTVCLSYQYAGLEDTVEEKQEVNVGKPLIAKLDMHRGLGRNTCFQACRMPDEPYHSSTPTAGGAGHFHSSQDSFHEPQETCFYCIILGGDEDIEALGVTRLRSHNQQMEPPRKSTARVRMYD